MAAARAGATHTFAFQVGRKEMETIATQGITRNEVDGWDSKYHTIELLPLGSLTIVADTLPIKKDPSVGRAELMVAQIDGRFLGSNRVFEWFPKIRKKTVREADGHIIPAGGCQMFSLVESNDLYMQAMPGDYAGVMGTYPEERRETSLWATHAKGVKLAHTDLTDRVCIHEADFMKLNSKTDLTKSKTFRVKVKKAGTLHAAMFSYDIWSDRDKTEVFSTADESRSFQSNARSGPTFQLVEECAQDWKSTHKVMKVQAGEWVDVAVEFYGTSGELFVKVRKAPMKPGKEAGEGPVETETDPDDKEIRRERVDRSEFDVEMNTMHIPRAGEDRRAQFFKAAIDAAATELEDIISARPMKLRDNDAGFDLEEELRPTLLDSTMDMGLPAMYAAKQHEMATMAMTPFTEQLRIMKNMAKAWKGVKRVTISTSNPTGLFAYDLPKGKQVDAVVVDLPGLTDVVPNGTQYTGYNPFTLITFARQKFLKKDGIVIPGGACLEVGVIESEDIATTYSVPSGQTKNGLDVTVWNEGARDQGTWAHPFLSRGAFHANTSLSSRWIMEPKCMYDLDYNELISMKADRKPIPAEDSKSISFEVLEAGKATAVVAYWKGWAHKSKKDVTLGPDEQSLGSDGLQASWPHFIKPALGPSNDPGVIAPISMKKGEEWSVKLIIRNGEAKYHGIDGPEFDFKLERKSANKFEL
eukprot:gnl/TRDRNA2_/TRDRNA2_85007_c0_seq1.p1 gnl/TRDRNA2_/TRDRNA2_85007_c0~~gnl/TRDRNA2_/TRDRNA2_85007_c0_seq1.p1  ORF type:complete len:800 (+),score=162.79 gnl/TRDRNA2_/TRDRNA2_85007_c0_seq1:309-2402(+)